MENGLPLALSAAVGRWCLRAVVSPALSRCRPDSESLLHGSNCSFVKSCCCAITRGLSAVKLLVPLGSSLELPCAATTLLSLGANPHLSSLCFTSSIQFLLVLFTGFAQLSATALRWPWCALPSTVRLPRRGWVSLQWFGCIQRAWMYCSCSSWP